MRLAEEYRHSEQFNLLAHAEVIVGLSKKNRRLWHDDDHNMHSGIVITINLHPCVYNHVQPYLLHLSFSQTNTVAQRHCSTMQHTTASLPLNCLQSNAICINHQWNDCIVSLDLIELNYPYSSNVHTHFIQKCVRVKDRVDASSPSLEIKLFKLNKICFIVIILFIMSPN